MAASDTTSLKNRTNGRHNGYQTFQNEEEGESIEMTEQEPMMARAPQILDPTCFFRDGHKKIDFVVAWEEELEKPETGKGGKDSSKGSKDDLTKDKEAPREETKKEKEAKKEAAKKERWRNKFLKNLKRKLLIEEETKELDGEKIIHFLKLHAPFDVLCSYAETMSFRAPLQAYVGEEENWSAIMLEKFHLPNPMAQTLPRHPLHFFTCPFRNSKINRFLGSDNKETFFTDTQRSRIVWEILNETPYGQRHRAQIGIERLLEEEVFTAAYSLHCGTSDLTPEQEANASTDTKLNDRQILRWFWARWGEWNKYQPLDQVRDYFGEQIALYFAWLGFYTAWLLPASVLGVVAFLYGVFTAPFDSKASQICSPAAENYTMCPQCDTCDFWTLGDTCLYARISYMFDNYGTVAFAVFTSFWAVFFLEYWKRTNAELAYRWDVTEFEEEEESIRPKYAALAPTTERNPVTGVIEPHFPERMRLPRIASAVVGVAVMIALVLIFIVAVILYRIFISVPLFQINAIRSQSQLIANFSSSILNLILIMALSKVYDILAVKLTEWEMHRTQTEFDDALISKAFLFQFINFYSSILYIGFFKGKFVGYPGHYNSFLGVRPEECANGSCLVELAQALLVIFVGKQLIGNIQEIAIPKVKTALHRFHLGGLKAVFSNDKTEDKPRWEEDYEMIPYEGLFEEYLEMVLQYGFVTIFVAAFPLAPLFALLNNWAEIRLDSQKLICDTRRPVAERAQDIGIWFSILEILTRISVISNAFLIAFTSDFLPQLVYKADINQNLVGYVDYSLAWAPPGTTSQPCRYMDYRDPEGHHTMFYYKLLIARLAFVIVFEHIVFGIQRLIDFAVPDVPEKLELKIKREKYLAKQALADTDEINKLMPETESSAQLLKQVPSVATMDGRNNQEVHLISEVPNTQTV